MQFLLLLALSGATTAFTSTRRPLSRSPVLLHSTKTTSPAAEETKREVDKKSIPDFSSSTKPLDESKIFSDNDGSSVSGLNKKWQENLEILLSPDTPIAERQIVLSDLLNSSEQIQDSVRAALRERKVRSSIMVCVVSKNVTCFIGKSNFSHVFSKD